MDFSLTVAQEDVRSRAARFIDEHCIPLEVESELAGGRVSPETWVLAGDSGCAWRAGLRSSNNGSRQRSACDRWGRRMFIRGR